MISCVNVSCVLMISMHFFILQTSSAPSHSVNVFDKTHDGRRAIIVNGDVRACHDILKPIMQSLDIADARIGMLLHMLFHLCTCWLPVSICRHRSHERCFFFSFYLRYGFQ